MSKNRFSKFSLIGASLLLMLILAGGYVSAQAPLSTTAATGTAFTYQGYLEDASGAVDGNCDFKFTLYDASNPVSGISPVTASNVSVSNGKFATTLDFGTSAFIGDTREMLIEVRCPTGSGSYSSLSPRVALTAAPYALSLRPGAVISGTDTSGSILSAVDTATTGSGAGLYGEARSNGGAGISGWNVGGTGGYAIYGNNTAGAGTPYGIYGIASDSGSATSTGVYGESNSTFGTGVKGIAPMNGVYGESTATSGNGWGVYGKTNSPNGYGVYSKGDAHVEGDLTWKAMTSTVSLPGIAFRPFSTSDAFTYDLIGGGVSPENASSTDLFSQVQLPNNAMITKLSFFWEDSSNADAEVSLYKTNMQGGEDMMAAVSSSGGSSGGGGGTTITASSVVTITPTLIDNTVNSYYLYLNTPTDSNGATITTYGVTIEYTITQPY